MGGTRSSKTAAGQGGGQGEFFPDALFPVRVRGARMQSADFSLRLKSALGDALKACPDKAAVVAANIADMTGAELSADALYAYTAPSKPDHQISVIRFKAFVRATDARWLYDVLVEDEGLVVIAGEDAPFAQLGALRQRRAQIDDLIRALERSLKARPAPHARPGERT
jgi:hypothetical protein